MSIRNDVVAQPGSSDPANIDETDRATPTGIPAATAPAVIDSPPATALPAREELDPRARVQQLILELTRAYNRRLMAEYLRLRRAM